MSGLAQMCASLREMGRSGPGMRIVVMNNPVSGRGRSGELADLIGGALTARGCDVERRPTPVRADDPDLIRALGGADAAVVVGGDGAMRRVAPALLATSVPVYNAPSGTENLFARQFGMTAAPRMVADAVAQMRTRRVDVGLCGGEVFLLMCSVGADAAIVHRLTRNRRGAITHASYARHVVAEMARGRSPRLTIRAGGATVVEDRPGAVIVANSRQYALRIDPAPDASMEDGLLDLVFLPASTSAGTLLWGVALRVRLAQGGLGRRMGVVRGRAESFEITVNRGTGYCQLDGDAREAELSHDGDAVVVGCSAGRLVVLLP